MKALGTLAFATALAGVSCTPDWASNSGASVVLLMTAINGGSPLDSDLRISNGAVCPDLVGLRVENHFKNPGLTNTGFRHDITIERYEVSYIRSDGHNTPGVDVPYLITGSVAQEIIEESAATLLLEVVRRQAKLEPPLQNLLGGGGEVILTMFAEVTIHGRTTTGQITNAVTQRLQIDFADFVDDLTQCPVVTGT